MFHVFLKGFACGRQQLLAAFLTAGLVLSASAYGAENGSIEGGKTGQNQAKMSVSYKRVPLERVLDYISRVSRGINIKVSVDDPNEEEELKRMLVSVDLANVTWRTAVEYIARKYSFVVNADNESDGIVLLERPPRITMNVQAAPIESVIKLIAAESGSNIIIGPEVQGNISFDIHDVPWEDAIDSILKAQGYIKVQDESGIIRITTPERVQAQHEIRAVVLKYITPEGAHFQPILSSEFVARRSAGTAGEGAEQSLLAILNQIKSPEGNVTYESRSNMVILKDTATRIEEMIDVIREIDKAPRQVELTVRILTQRTDPDSSTMGVDWANGVYATVNGPSWTTAFPFNVGSDAANLGEDMGIFSAAIPTQTGVYEMTSENSAMLDSDDSVGTFTQTLGTMDMTSLQATLQFVRNRTDVNISQAPRIVTMDNQEATVFIGGVRRYALSSSEVTDGGSTESIEQQELLVGVQLLVVPHICGDTDNIILEVVPKEEEDPTFVSYSAGANSVDLPQSSMKIVHTRMMLKSTETGVIAGLVKHDNSKTVRKIPFLGDLPVLGYAFKTETAENTAENSIILVTPIILTPRDGDRFLEELDAVRSMAAGN